METEQIFIIEPETNANSKALKAFVKALRMKCKITEKPYNPDFVSKILQSEKEFKEGKSKRVKKEELNNFLGL